MATLIGEQAAVEERRRNGPDVILLGAVAVLSAFGLVMIYSVTRFNLERLDQLPTISLERQMIFVTAGLIAVLVFSLIDYRDYRSYLPMIYGGAVLLLVVVLFSPELNGARRWISLGFFNLQPAEFAKLVAIVTAAHLLSHDRETPRLSWLKIGQVLGLVGLLAILIVIEPDLGTTLTLPFVVMVMLFMAGAGWKRLTALALAGVAAAAAVFRFGLLQDHQLNRLRVFIDPTIDPQGIGYQLRQSKLAIGSGQVLGKGLFQGTQTNLAYVPEQETDFIFTAVGEQLGFVGGILVLAVFLVVIWRLMAIASRARDRFGAMVAIGIAAMLMFHIFVNIGMTIGIAPVTGLPLPFLSQGGSFYLAMAISIGIANSIWLRRSPVPGETTH